MPIPPLFKNQVESIAFEEEHDLVFDMSDPGTGKTRSRLEAFAKRRPQGAKAVLVLAPKSLLDLAWTADCKKYTPWLSAVAAYAENREKAFAQNVDLYITNHDAVKWLAKQPPRFFTRFDTLVIDESGAFKHHTSQRSKALAKIKKYFPRRILQNGTPNPNTVLDIWNQVAILDDGKRLGKSFYAFRSAVCTPQQVGPQPNMLKWADKAGSETAVADQLRDITIRHRLEDCVDIPENHSYTVDFVMSRKHRAAYDEMERQAILDLDTGQVKAINAAVLVTKLLQIASGAVYDDQSQYHVIDEARYDLVIDLLDARKHSLCFFLWQHQKDLLIQKAKERGLTYTLIDGSVGKTARQQNAEHFQAGFYRVMFAHPQSAAHGLTLTKGTTTLWASPTFNLEHWIQGNHRIVRAGQHEKTETIGVLASGTIETSVYSRMQAKHGKLDDLLAYFKEKSA